MRIQLRYIGLIFSVLSSIFIVGCDTASPPPAYELNYTDGIMGTSFSIKATKLPVKVTAAELKLQLKTILDNLNSQLSTYEPESELSKFNQSSITTWQSVSSQLMIVVQEAQRISLLTKGAFDISVAPLVNLWGFGSESMSFTAPALESIQAIQQNIGYQHLHIDPTLLQIQKDIPELSLDLSSIAKGYAVDQVALALEAAGVQDYLVEVGGEIRVKGLNNQGSKWNIAIEKPTANQRILQKVLPISDIAVATSGDYRNFFEVDGIRYSHTINPLTGQTIKHNLVSVTVLNPTAMTADALATGFMVLGFEQALLLAEQEQIAALFILKTSTGFVEKPTSMWLNFIQEKL